jgi:ATP-dependent protease ClpP protease subunit
MVGSDAVIDFNSNLPFISYPDARFTGALINSPYLQLRLALQTIPRDTNLYVKLNSQGGDARLASMITKLINDRCSVANGFHCAITTYVEGTCASACISIFRKTGHMHLAAAGARFGFHASRNIFLEKVEIASEDDSVQFYADAGVNLDWLRQQRQTGIFSKIEMSYFPASEMMTIGFVDEISVPQAISKIAR